MIVVNNPKLSKDIQKRKEDQNINDYNIKGSVCSYFLQEYENRILETIYLYCYEKKLIKNNCVLCADGLMIPKANYKPELLDEFKKVSPTEISRVKNSKTNTTNLIKSIVKKTSLSRLLISKV